MSRGHVLLQYNENRVKGLQFIVKIEKQNSEDRIQNKKVYVIFIDGDESSGMIHERLS